MLRFIFFKTCPFLRQTRHSSAADPVDHHTSYCTWRSTLLPPHAVLSIKYAILFCVERRYAPLFVHACVNICVPTTAPGSVVCANACGLRVNGDAPSRRQQRRQPRIRIRVYLAKRYISGEIVVVSGPLGRECGGLKRNMQIYLCVCQTG